MIPIVLVGAAGRMGQAVDALARGSTEFQVRVRVDQRAHWPNGADTSERGGVWSEQVGDVVRAGDVCIEFSSPEAAVATASACAQVGAALVSGTTGLPADSERRILEAAGRVAVVRASNFSLGLAALRRALASAMSAIPRDWDVEIVERHHRRKLDSPSGTALTLAEDVAKARGGGAPVLRHGREGRVGERPRDEIGMHSVRGGSWVGEHAVLLAGEGEWIELRHVTQDRGAFAAGALAAARFAASARPGLYGLDRVLGAG